MNNNLSMSLKQWSVLRALRDNVPVDIKGVTARSMIDKKLIALTPGYPGYCITKLGALVLMMKQARENSHDAASST